MNVDIDPTKINVYKADDRGRITLGIDYAGEEVTVAIIDES